MIDVKDLLKNDFIDKEVTVQGWIRNHRKQKDFGFIDFNDGTFFRNLQIVYDNSLKDFEEIQKSFGDETLDFPLFPFGILHVYICIIVDISLHILLIKDSPLFYFF